jgi:uncharacterized protein
MASKIKSADTAAYVPSAIQDANFGILMFFRKSPASVWSCDRTATHPTPGDIDMNSTALTCTVVLGLILFLLGLAISVVRTSSGTLSGQPPDPDRLLTKLVRAHGNTAEYAAFLAVLFLYLGSRNPPEWQIWCMAGATVCRVLLVIALLAWPTMSKPNPARAIGAMGTYGFGVALCAALIVGR